MRFDIISLFPDFFASPLEAGIIGRALQRDIAQVNITYPREFTTDRYHKVDDEPYGGGVGMVMKIAPIVDALESLPQLPRREVLLMTPQGEAMNQSLFWEWSQLDQLVMICGHYEGIDERILNVVTREVSLGDFVLTCGEIPALTILNGVTRLLPGTVAKPDSLYYDSFEAGLLDYPHYTRPAEFRGWSVPDVLRSGNHGAIAQWRQQQQIERTRQRRPDLYQRWQQKQKTENLYPDGSKIQSGEIKES